MNSIDNSKSTKRKRARIPTSCSLCRRKKIKCDRKRPFCGECLANDKSHLCKYEVQPWSKEYFDSHDDTKQQAIEKLEWQVKSLQKVIDQQKVELDARSETDISTSVTSTELHKNLKDKNDVGERVFLNLVEKFGYLAVKDSRLRYFGPTSSTALILNDEHSSAIYSKYFKTQKRRFKEILETHGNFETNKYDHSGETGDCSHQPAPSYDIPELPHWQTTNLLLRHFFDFCYPFLPFIDEETFMQDLKPILQKKINHIDLTPVQESTFAILLILLRYSYITLPSNENLSDQYSYVKFDMEQRIILSKANIPRSYVEYAKHLVISPKSFCKMTLRTIQAAIFLRIYKTQCPEDDDIPTDNDILLASLIQMARFHGFHRTSSVIDKELADARDIFLWKKIWSQLLYLDAMQSFANGTTLLISDDEVDNHVSFITRFDNINSLTENSFIIRLFHLKYLTAKLTRKIVYTTSKLRGFKRLEMEELVTELLDLINNKMRTFDQLCNSDDGFINDNTNDRLQEFMLRIDLFHKLYTLYYLLFLTTDVEYETDLREKYLLLALERGLIISKLACDFANNPSLKFGSEFATIAAPSIWVPLYKILPNLYSFFLRVMEGEFSLIKCSKYFKSPDSSGLISWAHLNYESEEDSVKNLAAIYDQLNSKCFYLTVRFFHCYRVCFTFNIILDYIRALYPLLVPPDNKNYNDSDQIHSSDRGFDNNGVNSASRDNGYDKLELEQFFDFDYFLSNLHSDFDPFLNDFHPDGNKYFEEGPQ